MDLESSCPRSDGHFLLSLLGLGFCLSFACLTVGSVTNSFVLALGCIVLYAAPQVFHAIFEHRRKICSHFNIAIDRIVLTKLVALYFVLGLFGLLLHFWGFYSRPRFEPTKIAYLFFAPSIAILAIPYFCTVNRMQTDKKDEYYRMGALLTGRFAEVDFKQIRHFWLGWFVKLFFFPLMFWELDSTIASIDASTLHSISFLSLTKLIYVADVVIASAGYLFTLRLFDWHIRSVNPLFSGWFFALICYYPFFNIIREYGLVYEDGLIWSQWLQGRPVALAIWGGAIILLKLCWIYAISPFGLRFSNLTNRGIITSGGFRWIKHPSYISKNLFWWLIYIPFVTYGPPREAVKNCAILLLINGIYYCRAKSEEKHLSENPKYIAYSKWIDQHGLLAILKKGFFRILQGTQGRAEIFSWKN